MRFILCPGGECDAGPQEIYTTSTPKKLSERSISVREVNVRGLVVVAIISGSLLGFPSRKIWSVRPALSSRSCAHHAPTSVPIWSVRPAPSAHVAPVSVPQNSECTARSMRRERPQPVTVQVLSS